MIDQPPTRWPRRRIADLFDIQLGKMLSQKARAGNSPYPYVRNIDVQWGRVNTCNLPVMDFDTREAAKFELIPGDVLVCEGGEPGRAAVWPGTSEPCYYQKAIHRLRRRTDAILPEFYVAWARVAFRQHGEHDFRGAKTTIAHLPAIKLAELTMPLPEIVEQHAIAAIISKIQEAIDAQISIVTMLKELKAAAMTFLFSGWPEWQEEKLGRLCVAGGIQTGPFGSLLHKSDYVSMGVPLLNPTHYKSGRITKENLPRVSSEIAASLDRFRLEPGDLVFSRRGDVTSHAFVSESEGGWLCGTGSLIVRADTARVNGDYLFWVLSAEPCTNYLIQHAVGTIMPNINTKILAEVPVPFPSPSDQERIADSLNAIENSLLNSERQLSAISDLFDAALELLMTGDCRLADDCFSVKASGGV